jgi:hypothetical protein
VKYEETYHKDGNPEINIEYFGDENKNQYNTINRN